MGKGPSGSKRQQGAANQRDTRHENGLVGPGKRVQKQKSNGHLNGPPKPDSNSSTPPLPGTPLPTNGYVRHSISADVTLEPKMVGENWRESSFSGPTETSFDPYLNGTAATAAFENHRQIDVNAAKDPAVHHDSGPLSFVLTVLRSCPLGDTLAILIVLLQIPPTFLSIVHLLFTTLTFVPPSSAINSGLTFTDMLQGTFGSPAIGTTFLIDIIFLLIWLFLWDPLQNIALDLAQMVIALTLGGGTSGKKAGMYNVLWCFAIIGVTQFLRSSRVSQAGLRTLIPAYIRFGNPDPDDPLEPSSLIEKKKFDHGWLRSILAIHILTQGVVRYIRDWYVRRENRDNSVSAGDPEAAKLTVDGSVEAIQMQHSDNDTMSAPSGNMAFTTKKKKKHSTLVRMRQPLWAALASTKVVMVKEYETSHTAAESAGTNATDLNNLGNAPFDSEADRIWISYIGSEEVYFSTSFFPIHNESECSETDRPTRDIPKPFFVKVNNTTWHATRIIPCTEPELEDQGKKWSGEIFGLTPTASYQCEFVSIIDGTVLFSTSVRTLQSPTADLAAGLPTTSQTSARPGSPVSTLKTSIASSDIKLAEEKSRVNRMKKDHRARVGAIRAELDKSNGKLLTTGGTDDRMRQKAQQNRSHLKQAEESISLLNTQIDELAAIPEKEQKQYLSAKSSTYSQRDKHSQSRKELGHVKQNFDTSINTLKHESTSVQQKTESKQARLMFLNTKHESIEDANKQGLDEAQRHDRERNAKKQERQTIRKFYTERLQALSGQMYEGTAALNAVSGAIETLCQVQQEIYAQNQSPSSSAHNLHASFNVSNQEGLNVSASPWNPAPAPLGPFPNSYNMFGAIGQSSHRSRGRSSSMLSNVSKFTQSSDEFPGNGTGKSQIFLDAREERKDSSGSASVTGSGSGSGSVVDPKSPTVGNIRPIRW